MVAFGLLVFSKLCLIYTDRHNLSYILNSAFEDWELIRDENEIRQMIDCSQTSNKMATIFYCSGMASLVSYVAKTTIFDEPSVKIISDSLNNTVYLHGQKFILPGSCMFNNINQYFYYVIFANQCGQMVILCSTNLGTDTMFAAITGHIYIQFDILMERMKKFGENQDDVNTNSQELGRIVQRHQSLILSAETLEKVYNKVIFVQMFTTVSVLSVGG